MSPKKLKIMGLFWWSSDKESTCQWVPPLVWRDSTCHRATGPASHNYWGPCNERRKWQPTPVFLPGESQGWRSLVGCCLWGRRVRHDWSDLACMHVLEKEMATHSSILAWRIQGTEEPGGLLSMGSQSWTWLKRLSSSKSSCSIVYICSTLTTTTIPRKKGKGL